MILRQLTYDEVLSTVSTQVDTFFDPFRETLALWKERTEVIREPWSDAFGTTDDNRITLHGYRLHDHLEASLMRRWLGIQADKQGFWIDNVDLVVDALNRAPAYQVADEVTVRVIDGQVVHITELPIDLRHHIDYFDLMISRYKAAFAHTTPTIALAGYLLDPMWAHLRLLPLPANRSRTFYLGASFDANYLPLTKAVRGRANVGLFAYDFQWESMLTLDGYWSLRAPDVRSNTNDDLLERFDQRTKNLAERYRTNHRRHSQRLGRWNNRSTPRPWRQRLMHDISTSVGAERTRSLLYRYDEQGLKSPTSLVFAFSSLLSENVFMSRIVNERMLATELNTLMGGS